MHNLGLVGWVTLCLAIGAIGSIATREGVNGWYRSLRKPRFNPPNSIFAPVWTSLYILMGISAWLVTRHPGWEGPIAVFLVQLALNLLWSFVFFKFQNPKLALINLLVLDGTIAGTIFLFWSVSPAAGWLLIPYLAWCMFATYLNKEIVHLNPKG